MKILDALKDYWKYRYWYKKVRKVFWFKSASVIPSFHCNGIPYAAYLQAHMFYVVVSDFVDPMNRGYIPRLSVDDIVHGKLMMDAIYSALPEWHTRIDVRNKMNLCGLDSENVETRRCFLIYVAAIYLANNYYSCDHGIGLLGRDISERVALLRETLVYCTLGGQIGYGSRLSVGNALNAVIPHLTSEQRGWLDQLRYRRVMTNPLLASDLVSPLEVGGQDTEDARCEYIRDAATGESTAARTTARTTDNKIAKSKFIYRVWRSRGGEAGVDV